MQRNDHVETQGEGGVYTLRSEASEDSNPAHVWISDFQTPGL